MEPRNPEWHAGGPRDIVDFTRKPADSLAMWREHHSDDEIHDRILAIRPQMGEYYQRYLNEMLDLLED